MEQSAANSNVVAEAAARIRAELAKVIVGQAEAVEQVLIALLSGGHVLLEGVPGVAKTLLARAVALAVSADFNRVQFTPDLMPSDVIGTNVFDPSTGKFSLRRGPVFTGILLADEINRTPPKTQAALLEAMEEKRVTIDGQGYPLDPVFTVIATQNPIEYEGTYPLPEAQIDRFMFKTVIGYPSLENEMAVLARHSAGFSPVRLEEAGVQPAIDAAGVLDLRKAVAAVTVEPAVVEYIAALVRRTRDSRSLVLGASPRASIYLLSGAKARAAMVGRGFVIPDDVKEIAPAVLRHRLILRPEAEIEGVSADSVARATLAEVEVPRS